MPFNFNTLEIEGLILVTPKVIEDPRGFFCETYKKSDFEKNGIHDDFCQDNHSKSERGVIRGLHYQIAPKAQAKLVRCVKGEIFDVAVDLRKNSKTFGKWAGRVLSEENRNIFYIPEGFAHGFSVLSDEAEIVYKSSNEYSPMNERGINWNDPEININWGSGFTPLISEKDHYYPFLRNAEAEDLF